MRQSHNDRTMITMIVRQPYDVSLFESAGVSVLCCILFYTFEVPSQLKMIYNSCTRLLHDFLKVHEDHKATVRSPYGSRKAALRHPCDLYVRRRRQHDDRTISLRSPHGLSMTLHRSVVDTRQRNRTMAVLM